MTTSLPRKDPIRLRVAYKTPQTLLSEFTRSLGRGSVALETRRELEVGTRFLFELVTEGVAESIEVEGEVVRVSTSANGRHLLHINYRAPDNREGLDALIQRIFDAHQYEKARRYPRIPIQVRATEDTPYSPSYIVRDLSKGGVGVEIEAPAAPEAVKVGAPFLLEMSLSIGNLLLHGEIVWVVSLPAERSKWINPSFGVSFGKLRLDTQSRLETILQLRGLPPPPWKARISFGMDAISRMP